MMYQRLSAAWLIPSVLLLQHAPCIAVSLEEVLANDMIPPGSPLCDAGGTSHNNTFFDFSHKPSTSSWNSESEMFENLVFLVEMQHEDRSNVKRSWTIRVGTGGQIYSWQGPFGEAIPPQSNPKSAWIDTVLQMVSVNRDRNKPPDNNYFIHQAGTYNNDPLHDIPFYSPTLGVYCTNSYCDVVSWGQQAHVPSKHQSDVLYYVRYRNCGDGVLEVTQVIHNAAYANDDEEDVLGYLNVPWTGVRRSTFYDVLLSNKTGDLYHDFPLRKYGSESPISVPQTGGFTVFAQKVTPPPEASIPTMPCIHSDKTQQVDCETHPNATQLKPIMQRDNSARLIGFLSERVGHDIVRFDLFSYASTISIIEACRQFCGSADGLLFINARTGYAIQVKDVLHWVWRGRFLYASPNVTAAEINENWKEGDEILIEFAPGLDQDENLGLTFVHGQSREASDPSNTWITRANRIFHGAVGNVDRDASIFTINFIGKVKPGDTYVNRQFIVSGELKGIEARARALAEESYQTMMSFENPRGQNLTLYTTDTAFTVSVGDDPCNGGESLCTGSTTPTKGMFPLLYVTCGNETYVGSDQYHFAPPRTNATEEEPLRPYVCHGHSLEERPSWKLLGYFPEGDCLVLEDFSYDTGLCM